MKRPNLLIVAIAALILAAWFVGAVLWASMQGRS